MKAFFENASEVEGYTIFIDWFCIMCIETYGAAKRLREAARLSRELELEHLILLPVPSTKDGFYVTGTDIPLFDTLTGVGEGTYVFGYGLPAEYTCAVISAGGTVYDLLFDEPFLCENAYITAVGALGYILTSISNLPEALSFGVVGYGRIGREMVRLLLFLGAKAIIYTSKAPSRIELGECGVCTRELSPTSRLDLSGVDILINTAERSFESSFAGGNLPIGLRVIELASGKNFDGIAGVEYLPALPEKMYSQSGGRAYFNAIKRLAKRGCEK